MNKLKKGWRLKKEYKHKDCTFSLAFALFEKEIYRGILTCPVHGSHSPYDIYKQEEKYFEELNQ